MTDNTPHNPEAFSETPLENNHTNPQFEHLQYAWGDAALRGIAAAGCGRSDRQLNTFDYLADVPGNLDTTDFVEVQFKNTRKGFYRNDNHLPLEKGDIVAVEAQPGHDLSLIHI